MTPQEIDMILQVRSKLISNARYLMQIQKFHSLYQFHKYEDILYLLDSVLGMDGSDYSDVIPPWIRRNRK